MQDRKFTKRSPDGKPTERKAGKLQKGRQETYRKEAGVRQDLSK
jgi:hypothetical protein